MDELLQDYLTEDKVFISKARANRPQFYIENDKKVLNKEVLCPFCPENSFLTPDAIMSSEDGRIRIVKNKYPAVYEPHGYHDVVIDTDKHDEKFIDFSLGDVTKLFLVLQKRVKDLYKEDHIKYVQVFKNDGSVSGASIIHSHWQIIALDFIPQKQRTICNNFDRYFSENSNLYMNDVYMEKDFLFYENTIAFAYCPKASIFSNMIRISLKDSVEDFQDLSNEKIVALCETLMISLNALHKILGNISFNIIFHLNPKGYDGNSTFFIEILPRHGIFAGFELSTKCYINSVLPIEIAKKLREVTL